MNYRLLAVYLSVSGLAAIPSAASAQALLDQTNLPVQTSQPYLHHRRVIDDAFIRRI